MTAAEDRSLVCTAQGFIYAHAALTRADLASLFKELWGKEVRETWARDWVRRQKKELSTRACKSPEDKRSSASAYDQVVTWVAQLEAFFKDNPLPPSPIINYDEHRLVMNGEQLAIQRVQSGDRERANASSTRNNTVATLMTFVGDSGKPFLSEYVFRAHFGEDDTTTISFTLSRSENHTRCSWPCYHGWKEKGFFDSECFAAVVNLICELWRLQNILGDVFVVGDQLAAHK